MKKNIAIALVILCLGGFNAFAQDNTTVTETPQDGVLESDVCFSALKPTSKKLSATQKDALQKKVEKIIARAGAGNISECDAFGIEADIEITSSKTSMGLVRDVSVVEANVTLTAKNIKDGSLYYSKSIEVTADAIGQSNDAVNDVITRLKVTDPAFVRFVKTARGRIAEWYNSRHLELPMKVQNPAKDTVFVDRPVAKPVQQTPQHAVEDVSVPKPTVEPTTVPQAAAPASCKVKVSTDKIQVSFVSCIGNSNNETITIAVNVTNISDGTNLHRCFNQAWAGGDTSEQLKYLTVADNDHGKWEDYPRNIKIRRNFTIHNVSGRPSELSLVLFNIGNSDVEIRDIPVTWK